MHHPPTKGTTPVSSPPESASILRLEHVGKTYQMGEVAVEVLRDICLNIRDGEFLAMLGPSGSGKSTILNLLGGLDSPTVGKVWHRDRDLTACSARELTRFRRASVGFVFQFYNLVPSLTARENVLVSTEVAAEPRDVDETLDRVDLHDRAEHFPSQLSGGEQQRVAIARAIAKNPEFLLCDEPTGALDFTTGKLVLRLLVDVNRQLGKTIVLITHNAALAAIADRVVRLRSGEIVEVTEHDSPAAPEEIEW